MTRTSMRSMPGSERGRSRSVAGSVAASLRHGIWMISFATAPLPYSRSRADERLDHAVPRDRAGAGLAGLTVRRRQRRRCGVAVDRRRQRLGRRVADGAVDAIDDELERPARIAAGQDRLAGEERLLRHVAE